LVEDIILDLLIGCLFLFCACGLDVMASIGVGGSISANDHDEKRKLDPDQSHDPMPGHVRQRPVACVGAIGATCELYGLSPESSDRAILRDLRMLRRGYGSLLADVDKSSSSPSPRNLVEGKVLRHKPANGRLVPSPAIRWKRRLGSHATRRDRSSAMLAVSERAETLHAKNRQLDAALNNIAHGLGSKTPRPLIVCNQPPAIAS